MNKSSAIPVIAILLITFIASDCVKETEDNQTDCTNSVCTMDFRMVNVLVKNSSDNSPVLLTDYKVIRLSDNADITLENNGMPEDQGYYTLINDSQTVMLRNRNVEVEFRGYIGNSLVISRRFIVSADCCHIYHISGELLIFI